MTGSSQILAAAILATLLISQESIGSSLSQNDPASSPMDIISVAEQAMGTDRDRSNIRSISAIAACHSPKADYETRMISDRQGNLSFQQFFADHKNIEGIVNGRGWELGKDGHPESIDTIEMAVLRSHEFPFMALDFRKRFHDFKTVGRTQFEGQPATELAMTDELGHPAHAYFSLASHLPLAIVVTKPRPEEPRTITLRFDTWKLVANVKLVSHVTIFLGSEIWVFDFRSLEANAANNKVFEIPRTLSTPR
jgi:hypothetical protein